MICDHVPTRLARKGTYVYPYFTVSGTFVVRVLLEAPSSLIRGSASAVPRRGALYQYLSQRGKRSTYVIKWLLNGGYTKRALH